MIREAITGIVADVIARHCPQAVDRVAYTRDCRLRDDLGMRPLDLVSIALALEGALGIKVGDDELAEIATVGNLVDLAVQRGEIACTDGIPKPAVIREPVATGAWEV